MPYLAILNFWALAYILVDLWPTFPQNSSIAPGRSTYLCVKFGESRFWTVTCRERTDRQTWQTDKRRALHNVLSGRNNNKQTLVPTDKMQWIRWRYITSIDVHQMKQSAEEYSSRYLLKRTGFIHINVSRVEPTGNARCMKCCVKCGVNF